MIIAEKYEVVDKVGQGGMGVVYRVRHIDLDTILALKILSPGLVGDAGLVERFRREARLMARLRHDSIVRVFDFARDGDVAYLTMEFLQGRNLRQVLNDSLASTQRPLPLTEVLRIGEQIASALAYSHGQTPAVIHRDIKPSNVIVEDGTARVVVTDFGIAKLMDDQQGDLTRDFLGTPKYCAPEQLGRGADIDGRVDIYSLGLVLYELFAGRQYFAGQSDMDVFRQLFAPHEENTVDLPDAPRGFVHLVERAIARNREARYATAQDLLEEIHRLRRETPAALAAVSSHGAASVHDASTGDATPTITEEDAARDFTLVYATRPTPTSVDRVAADTTQTPSIASDATAIFALPRSTAADSEDTASATRHGSDPPTSPEQLLDVALTIASCADAGHIGRRISVDRFPFLIGRAAPGLRLSFDAAISANHAELAYRDGRFTIRDLDSVNGTFVNGRRLQPKRPESLLFGARILLGTNTELLFVSNLLEELPDLTGDTVADRFKLVKKLHGSATAVVYLADDRRLPRPVVIKVLAPGLARHPGYREQFEREALLTSALLHPNVCSVIDYGTTLLRSAGLRESLYVCMEYMQGGSLSRRLDEGVVFDAPVVAKWLERLCDALDQAHDAKVIHGNIKPSAIVFDIAGNPYLTDFALATMSGDDHPRAILGAPAFLAPEQWSGADPVPATDQYSLAALTYRLVTGALPYEGQDRSDVREQNLLRGPVPAHVRAAQKNRPPLPAAVSTVLATAMANDPNQRFPSMKAFAHAFTEAFTVQASPAPRRPSVFISYHRRISSAWALLAKRELEREHGFEVFVDSEQRDTVGRFPQKLEQRIERCDVFVCLLGGSTLDSAWVRREIEVASRARKPMIPVFQESFQIPDDLSALDPHIQELLTYDGVKLLDSQNVYIDAALLALSHSIKLVIVS